MPRCAPLFAALVASTVLASAQAAENAIIVLDASGSMWGQIDGKPKLEIARATLDQVLAKAPPDMALGLMAYGHREKGKCSDIELVVPPRAGAAPAISAAAAKLKFLGMTPLSDAVTRAARELRYTEQKATVVLITDGLETCKADPCAVGTALEEAGIDFTAHVVGFGLSAEEGKQVACLAENTGGQYFAAADAATLAEALTRTVVEVPATPPPAEARLQAPDEVAIAARVTVAWTGPGAQYDDVVLFDPAARNGDGAVVDRQRLNSDPGFEQRTATLVAPARAGRYELRYYDGSHRRTLATRPLSVVEAAVSLEAPDSVPIASTLTVAWKGPAGRYDDLILFDPRARSGEGAAVDRQRLNSDPGFEQRTARITAPATPGDYELQYYNGDNKAILATRPLKVVAAEVSLSAPDSVPIASTVTVAWTGPAGRYDDLILFDPRARNGDGAAVDRQRLNSDPGFEQRTARVTAPATPGDYVLQYYNGDNKAILATRPLKVVAAEVALSAPDSAPMASEISVGWTGPGAVYDDLILFDPRARAGEGAAVDRQRLRSDPGFEQRTARVTAPATPGDYVLQYYNGENKAILATRPIRITPVTVALRAPGRAAAEARLEVGWTGPGARYDEVQVFDPAARNGEGVVLARQRLRSDPGFEANTVRLALPKAPGRYQLRYYNGDNKAVLATRPLQVD